MTKKYFLCDIDNCFADDTHRLHLIDWHLQGDERYKRYNEQMLFDPPVFVKIFEAFREIATPIFLTGRPQHFEGLTRQWLRLGLDAERELMLMRPSGTKGLPPADLKKQMLEFLLDGPLDVQDFSIESIITAFDDVPGVIAMYRSFGIPAIQLQAHDPAAAYDPEDLAPPQNHIEHQRV